MDSRIPLRNVDEDAINKCRLPQYGQMRGLVRNHSLKSGDYEQMEKNRASKGDYRLDAREYALEDSVEKIYFDFYGHGYNDSPVIDRPGAPYVCPCGLKMSMNAKTFPEECPSCHRLTPVGEPIRDGVMRR